MSFIKDLNCIRKSWKPRDLIDRHLPVSCQLGNYNWCSRSEQERDTLDLIGKAFENRDDGATDIITLKQQRGRSVKRARDKGESRILKGFSYEGSLGKQLYRHRLYALDEALSLLLASERGVPVPRVLSYGEQRSGIRVKASIVVMEDVVDAFHPMDVFRGDLSHGLEISEVLARLTPMMLKLYQAGCNHIDVHGTSFLLSKQDSAFDKMIDFQFAVFYPSPSAVILANQLAHFTKASQKEVEREELNDWASSVLHKALGTTQHDQYFHLYLKSVEGPVMSTYNRMMLKP